MTYTEVTGAASPFNSITIPNGRYSGVKFAFGDIDGDGAFISLSWTERVAHLVGSQAHAVAHQERVWVVWKHVSWWWLALVVGQPRLLPHLPCTRGGSA